MTDEEEFRNEDTVEEKLEDPLSYLGFFFSNR